MSIPPPNAPNIVPGYRLDRYELLCPLAQGGMASVWIARQTGKHGFEKLVAVKMILPQYAQDERFQKMFLDEAHIAAGIEHLNVAQILDLGEAQGVLYLAMEWIDGDAIAKLHRAASKAGKPIPPAIIGRMMIETCAGLHAAHELRGRDGELLHVVHRDISPQNVLVSSKGVCKVIDFGVAKARDRVAEETGAGMLKGKIRYMPPEQAMGKSTDRRADVWAVGAMMYHLLSDKLPFDGPNDVAALHRLLSNKPPLPLPSTVPAAFAEVIKGTLVHDPEKRIASCGELQKKLEEAMQQSSLQATNADVAAFMRDCLSERMKARKEAIDVALAAASERARVSDLLQLKESATSSGEYSLAVTNLGLHADANMPTLVGAPLPDTAPTETIAGITAVPLSTPSTKKRAMVIGGVAAVLVVAFVVLASRKSTPVVEPAAAKAVQVVSAPTATATVAATSTATATATETAAPSASAAPTPSVAPAAKATTKAAPTATAAVKKKKSKTDVDDGF